MNEKQAWKLCEMDEHAVAIKAMKKIIRTVFNEEIDDNALLLSLCQQYVDLALRDW